MAEESLFTEALVAPWAETESRPMGVDTFITWSVDSYLAPMQDFLQDVFDQLDDLLPNVTFTNEPSVPTEQIVKGKTVVVEESSADLEFKGAKLIYRGNIGGYAQYQEDDQQWDLLIKKDSYTNEFKQWLLLHELGHALGLEHPFDSSDGDVDEDIKYDSVMSYETQEGIPFFTQRDVDTITGIWNDNRFQDPVVEEPSGPPGRRKKSHTHDLKGSLLFS